MKKNITVKIFAFLALFGIIISVVGTGILIFFGDNYTVENENVLTQEALQEMIDSGEIQITNTGSETSTGETEK